MSRQSPNPQNARKEVIIWLAILAVLTFASVGWLVAEGINLESDFSPAIIVIAYASSLAAIITAAVIGGKQSVKELFSQIGHWRVSPKWYACALLLPVGVVGVAHLLSQLFGAETPSPWVDFAALAPGIAAIIAGGLGEELGWRGFAQPRLQRRFSIFWASVIIGVIWATWHSWPLLISGGMEGAWLTDTALTYLRLISTAIIYGWLYSVSGGSLLLVMIAHMAHNVALTTTIIPEGDTTFAVMVAVLYALAASIVTFYAKKRIFAKV